MQSEDAHPAPAEAEELRPTHELESTPILESDRPQPAESDKPQYKEPRSQDISAGDDALFAIEKRWFTEGENKKLLKRQARGVSRTARSKAAQQNPAATHTRKPAKQSKPDGQVFDVPDEEEFSVEEVRVAVERKRRAKSEQEIARRLKKKQDKMRKAEEDRIAREEERRKRMPSWAVQKEALKKKFPDGWRPFKRLSPDALNGIRALNQQFPDMFSTQVLSQRFEMSPEAIRRILRTNWDPTADEDEDRQRRWFNRGKAIWEKYEELGIKPPQKWRDAAIANNGPKRRPVDEEEERWRARARGEEEKEEYSEEDKAEMERRQRLKTQRRLAQNLM